MPSESKERKMMLVWLLGFSLLCLALTKPVKAGSRVHQTKVQSLRKWIDIQRAINPDVGEAKIRKKILSSSQSMPREEENNMDDRGFVVVTVHSQDSWIRDSRRWYISVAII